MSTSIEPVCDWILHYSINCLSYIHSTWIGPILERKKKHWPKGQHSLPQDDGVDGAQAYDGDSMTDLPDGAKQVAKLMEEDMGSAMQYLQGKGLCLMPISLATAISTATCHSGRWHWTLQRFGCEIQCAEHPHRQTTGEERSCKKLPLGHLVKQRRSVRRNQLAPSEKKVPPGHHILLQRVLYFSVGSCTSMG